MAAFLTLQFFSHFEDTIKGKFLKALLLEMFATTLKSLLDKLKEEVLVIELTVPFIIDIYYGE
jgi:hypothetical protein